MPHLTNAYRQGILIGLAQGPGTFTVDDLFSDLIRKALAAKSLEHASLAVATTKDQLAKVVEKAALEGLGTEELARNIREVFAFNSRVRSLRIARTEMTDTINDATSETLRREGYREKTWSTVVDGRERETHASADGQTVGISEPFTVGGASCMYPGHDVLPPGESINCRCTLVGAGIPEDRSRQVGRMFLRTHGSLEHKFVIALRKAFRDQRDRVTPRL